MTRTASNWVTSFHRLERLPLVYQNIRGYASGPKRRYPLDPDHADYLPVFQYVSEKRIPGTRVYTWGVSMHGALGSESLVRPATRKQKPRYYAHKPCRLSFAEQFKVVDIACGYGFSLFKVDDKKCPAKVFGCGLNTDAQIGYHVGRKGCAMELLLEPAGIQLPVEDPAGVKVKGMAAGRAHTLILTEDGIVWSLGNNGYGQCCRPIIKDEDYLKSSTIHLIHGPWDSDDPITNVTCGQDTSFFLSKKGRVFSCGWGGDGQTGLGHCNSVSHPSLIKGDIEGERISKISSTFDTVLALSEKQEVFGWGNSEYCQLEPGGIKEMSCNVPVQLKFQPEIGKIVDIAAGGSLVAVLNESGEVWVWGYGILGLGPKVNQCPIPQRIPPTLLGQNELQPDTKVVQIQAGMSHLAAVTNKGDLFMWGHNRGGLLGLGHDKDQYFPLRVAVGAPVKKVTLGIDHTMALCRDPI